MFHCHPCIFPCVFLNLWSQEKTSPYRKATFLFIKFQVLQLLYSYNINTFMIFIKINDFLRKIGPRNLKNLSFYSGGL